jgi:hypothetical protein
MPSTRAIVASIVRITALATLAAACNPPGGDPEFAAAGSPTPRRGGVLHFAAYQPVRTLDDEVLADMVDALALAFDQHREAPAHPRIDIEPQHFFVAHARAEHPLAQQARGQPGVEHAFGGHREGAVHSDVDGIGRG